MVNEKYQNGYFVSISDSDRAPGLNYLGTVYNGINLSLKCDSVDRIDSRRPEECRSSSQKSPHTWAASAPQDRHERYQVRAGPAACLGPPPQFSMGKVPCDLPFKQREMRTRRVRSACQRSASGRVAARLAERRQPRRQTPVSRRELYGAVTRNAPSSRPPARSTPIPRAVFRQ